MRAGLYLLITGCVVGLAWFCCATVTATDSKKTAENVNFDRDIKPILEARCLKCHGPEKRRGGLLLTDRAGALTFSDSGKKPIVPGHGDKSELVLRVLSAKADEQMPPTGPRLSAQEIALLKSWIDQGANWPSSGQKHWAYLKPERPALPKVKAPTWPQNAIDYFVLARLEQEGLSPAPPAEKATLLRRVYLDLIGLPPTLEQVDAFLNDDRPDAYERVVDELLASPHYGERWAIHWLDLARYADSNGFQRDGFRDIWPFRDWVIHAFNQDMPFDQFTIEQLAGDLLPMPTLEQKIATGFNRCTTVNVEAGVDQEEDRINAVFDRVNTTATVWLGTTMICAQCHNHKYDPFSQEEYYRLFAYFNATIQETKEGDGASREFTGPKVIIPLPADKEKKRQELLAQQSNLNKQLKKELAQVVPQQDEWEKQQLQHQEKLAKLPKGIATILSLPKNKRNKKQQEQLELYFTNLTPEIKEVRDDLSRLEKQLKDLQPPASLIMADLKTPRPTFVFKRGNFLDKLHAVQPGVPGMLHPLAANAPPNRLALAKWLVDRDNPLVARVTVNRWWAEFFGHGLVTSLEDFGTQSEPPTHPELLDWLATEFMTPSPQPSPPPGGEGGVRGWSMKKMHRLIVTSATYRQSSRVTPDLLKKDPVNKLYARGPRVRLPAELIRDNLLAVSGLLSKKLGGPPVFPPQPAGLWNVTGRVDNNYYTSKGEDKFRRGLYTIWRRSSPYPSFVAFDAPDRSSCTVKRPVTNTPLQALTLMNDPVYVEAALGLAHRMLTDHPKMSAEEKIAYGFRLCLTRAPSQTEVAVLQNLHAKALTRYQNAPQDVKKLMQYAPQPGQADSVQLAAWFQVATVLLNLDETITKN